METKKQNGSVVRYSTDDMARSLFLSMLSDFNRMYDRPFLIPGISLGDKVEEIRNYVFPDYWNTTIPRFKAWYQLQNFFKKYIFQNDVLTGEERHALTVKKYLDFQEARATYRELKVSSCEVLREARRISKNILGRLDKTALLNNCRFGRNSSIGCSLANAYLDIKLSKPAAFTGSDLVGSKVQRDIETNDPLLAEILRNNGIDTLVKTNSLTLVLVPKTWKILRAITPMPLLDLYRSYGIAALMVDKLEEAGLDLSTLQSRHASLVKKFSITRTHVTADLSSASDSITSWMLNRILPREWFCEIKSLFTPQVRIGESAFYTESILPMGNGVTFPCETLVFYSLIKAIGNLLGVDGIFSVYGDDLIYPRRIHSYVLAVFRDLGIGVNSDKTFATSFFRESCGSDYYHGVNVRPAFLPLGGQLTRMQYVCWLYKTANALLRRWSYEELTCTFKRLLTEIVLYDRKLLVVPPSYPDTSGLCIGLDHSLYTSTQAQPWSPVHIVFENGTRVFKFHWYKQTSKKRFVQSVSPFYWDKLRSMSQQVRYDPLREIFGDQWIEEDYSPSSLDVLHWRKITVKYKTVFPNGKKVSKTRVSYRPEIPARGSGRIRLEATYQTHEGSPIITDWI